MGNFYVNLALRTSDRDQVAAALADVPDKGVILAPKNGWTILSSERLETQDERIVEQYGEALSRGGIPVLGVMNHDDGVLMVYLYRDGARIAFGNTDPGMLTGEDIPPIIDGTEALAALTEDLPASEIEDLLSRDHVFAVEAHAELARLLGLPAISAGFGYTYYARGEFDDVDAVMFGH